MNQQHRIWDCHVDRRRGGLTIEVFLPDDERNLLTASQVQDTFRNGLPDGNEGVFETVFFRRGKEDPVPTEQELVMIAQSCQPVLADDMEKLYFWGFTDASVCRFLQNMGLSRDSTLKELYITNDGLHSMTQSMTETIAWVQNGPLRSVGALELVNVRLGQEDCRIIGQTISDRGSHLRLCRCSFPSCRDFLTLTAGIVNGKIRSNRHNEWRFWGCVLEDETIPSLGVQDDSTLNCYSIFAVLWNRYSDEKKEHRLSRTVAAFLDCFGSFHEAGLSNLVRFGEQEHQQQRQSEPRDWIDALAHDAVRDREDLLFHFLTLNPEMYATEALKRLGRS